ncbi:MAG: dethiobiotin synthase [Candidatus Delongbacteria bacterium]|nr:dethiobiotin synthase [Candidatus Delongbacteria bacterium]
MPVLFIAGIDTGIGKTFITGLLGRSLIKQNKTVITQKLVQTGCSGISEDIIFHRKIMGIELTEEDKSFQTCSYVFEFPASPHLSASVEKKRIDVERIAASTVQLSQKYDNVLIEGVGGLFVPLTLGYFAIDYIKDQKYPVVLVTSSRLGSINHTILSLEALIIRNIPVRCIIYIRYINEDKIIGDDSPKVFKKYLKQKGFEHVPVIEVPEFNINKIPDIDFSSIM